jgi:DNA-binding winged helix-turn-helix (wHTH) protein/TolB-like protein/Tfp pilus assembly protein PilF
MTQPTIHIYEFGPFSLDVTQRLLLRAGTIVPLRPKDFDLLFILVERHGRVVSKDELLRRMWPDSYVEEANLSHHVFTLRRAMGEAGGSDENDSSMVYIETLPRRGYRFVGEVRELIAGGDEVVRRNPATTVQEAQPVDSSRRVVLTRKLVTVASAVLLTAAGAIYTLRGPESALEISSLAVLPFKSVGADGNDKYLELGIPDALITRLSNIRLITVRPTSAVRKYADMEPNLIAAGRELHVDAALVGTVQKVGARIRVTVQLVSARDGSSLWAESFDEEFTDIFTVQDRISEGVARALTLTLGRGEKERLARRETTSAEAFQLYHTGRLLWNRRTAEGMKKSVDYFEQAIRMDRNYALAYAGLADSYNVLGQIGALPPIEAGTKAKAAALDALRIDSESAEIRASLALIKEIYDWDWTGAEMEFRRSIDSDQNCANARHWYAMFLSAMGRRNDALDEIKKAKELDPVSLIIKTNEGWIFFCAREYDQAIKQLNAVIQTDPDFPNAHYKLALAYEMKGMYKEAVEEELKEAVLLGEDPNKINELKAAYEASGWRGYCQERLDQLEDRAKRDYILPKNFALAQLRLGNTEQVFKWLGKAHDERTDLMIYLRVDPRFDHLRQDQRFQSLLSRVHPAAR